jgi:hypothetical protein
MIRRLVLVVVVGGLLAAGAAFGYEAHSLNGDVPTIRSAERQLQPQTAADRQTLRSLYRQNQTTATRLRRVKRTLAVLRREKALVERAAWRSAFTPARDDAYPAAYQDAFPLTLGSSDWYIVHAFRHGVYETSTYDAPEGQEYVVKSGSVYTYDLGGAPSPYGPSGTNQGYYNSDGIWVPSPSTNPGLEPGGPTAICADGTYSYSLHASGTCSWHGGVSQWLN